jgi:hypothetical protein
MPANAWSNASMAGASVAALAATQLAPTNAANSANKRFTIRRPLVGNVAFCSGN